MLYCGLVVDLSHSKLVSGNHVHHSEPVLYIVTFVTYSQLVL